MAAARQRWPEGSSRGGFSPPTTEAAQDRPEAPPSGNGPPPARSGSVRRSRRGQRPEARRTARVVVGGSAHHVVPDHGRDAFGEARGPATSSARNGPHDILVSRAREQRQGRKVLSPGIVIDPRDDHVAAAAAQALNNLDQPDAEELGLINTDDVRAVGESHEGPGCVHRARGKAATVVGSQAVRRVARIERVLDRHNPPPGGHRESEPLDEQRGLTREHAAANHDQSAATSRLAAGDGR